MDIKNYSQVRLSEINFLELESPIFAHYPIAHLRFKNSPFPQTYPYSRYVTNCCTTTGCVLARVSVSQLLTGVRRFVCALRSPTLIPQMTLLPSSCPPRSSHPLVGHRFLPRRWRWDSWNSEVRERERESRD